MRTSPGFKWTLGIVLVFGAAFFSVLAMMALPRDHWPRPKRWLCPALAWLHPIPHTPIQPDDFLELQSLGEGPRDLLTVRLYGDGRIERDTTIAGLIGGSFGCPLHEADKHLRITAAQANAILSKARDDGFCRLCQLYQSRFETSVGGYSILMLNLAGVAHRSSNISGDPPPLYGNLLRAMLSLSPNLPAYATAKVPTRDRELECLQFEMEQDAPLLKRQGITPPKIFPRPEPQK